MDFFKTGGYPTGRTNAALMHQVSDLARFLLFWGSVIGVTLYLLVGTIWGMVVYIRSPNNPPVEIADLVSLFISGGACAMGLAQLETLGKIKFYVFGMATSAASAMTFVFCILYFVYYSAFLFHCPGDMNTLQPFVCASGIPYNTALAAFIFHIIVTPIVFIGFITSIVVLISNPPPKMEEIKEEMRIEVIKEQSHIGNLPGSFSNYANQLRNRYQGSSLVSPAAPEYVQPVAIPMTPVPVYGQQPGYAAQPNYGSSLISNVPMQQPVQAQQYY